MYRSHFGISEKPFSITPDPRYLYMSRGHQEALAHLLYGIGEGGGFVLLTGEVGTGKTSLCRCLMEQLPDHVDLALILNPRLSEAELLASICDELGIEYSPAEASLKVLTDRLNRYLLDRHGKGRQVVVMIDEAQNLAPEVLELVRLLTNLETDKTKLLQIILVGQPELLEVLNRRDLRQLLQRVTARYHLMPLSRDDGAAYIRFRLAVAGLTQSLFTPGAIEVVYRASSGVPRLINVICDRCLLGAFAQNVHQVDKKIARRAVEEVSGWTPQKDVSRRFFAASFAAASAVAAVILGVAYGIADHRTVGEAPPQKVSLPLSPDFIAEETAAALTETLKTPRSTLVSDATQDAPILQTSIERPSATPGTAEAQAALTPEALPAGPAQQLAQALQDGDSSHSLEAALQGLFELWDRDYWVLPGLTPCDRAIRAGLDCYRGRNGWAGLANLNRPALVALFSQEGRQMHALVKAIEGDRVTLQLNGQEIRSSKQEVASFWSGEYLLFWRPPPTFRRALQIGVTGSDVVWLKEQFARTHSVGANESDGAAQRFDEALHEAVVAFQAAHALRADGVVGASTIIHLNSQTASEDVPLLTSAGP